MDGTSEAYCKTLSTVMKRVAGDLRRRGVEACCWSRESVTYCEWEECTSANVRDFPLGVGDEAAAAAAAAAAAVNGIIAFRGYVPERSGCVDWFPGLERGESL